MITVIDCFLAVNQQGYIKEEAEVNIDVGSPAIDRASYEPNECTLIFKENPVEYTGKITSIEVWAKTNISGFIIATFTQVSPDVFTARDSQIIGNITAGSKQIFAVDLDIEKDDFLGAYWSGGEIEEDIEGGLGAWIQDYDQTDCEEITFYFMTDTTTSIYGTGIGITTVEFIPQIKTIDCDLHVNENDENFFGRVIRCELEVQRLLVGACLATSQSIRLKITVDGEDVSNALVGQVMIQHNENIISTFSFNLGDFQYSPLLVGDYEDKEVVIISYVNGKEVKLFTGLVDGTRSDYSGKYNLNIYGSCYGKKLLKRMTLISVQEAATAKTRGAIIRYLANQAGITNMDVPTGSKTVIDHSFQDQFIWDMIQKEMMIEGWVIRFDENGKMLVYKKVIKTDETKYPTPDWEYGEDKFILLGLDTTREGIINQITILGAIFEEEVITVNELEVPPYEPVYDEQITTFSKSFGQGEDVHTLVVEDANFRVNAKYIGWSPRPGLPFNPYQNYRFSLIKLNPDLNIANLEWSVSGGADIYNKRAYACDIHRHTSITLPMTYEEVAFTITITIKTKEQTDGGIEQYELENPNEEVVSTITHTQIKAIVNDPASIAKYGERKPNEEGTEEYPLAETEAQCIDIGQRRIRDSHRYIKQPDYQGNFNPKIIVGECVKLTDKKIGYNGRWYIEEVIHYFDIDSETGAIKPRTRIGCVFYA